MCVRHVFHGFCVSMCTERRVMLSECSAEGEGFDIKQKLQDELKPEPVRAATHATQLQTSYFNMFVIVIQIHSFGAIIEVMCQSDV